MKEHGILMTAENQAKSVSGEKTMTRRIIRPQPEVIVGDESILSDVAMAKLRINARYQVGSMLYIKEPFRIQGYDPALRVVGGIYTRDNSEMICDLTAKEFAKFLKWGKPYQGKSSLFMFKSLARHWFEVTGVGCERLQDISEADAFAEGIEEVGEQKFHGNIWKNIYKSYNPAITCCSAVAAFETLWDSIYKDRDDWDSNPWVWVYKYKKTERR
jgi:hypothetical protein